MKRWQVKFHPIVLEVDAKNEDEAEQGAKEIVYSGEAEMEVDNIEEMEQ